MPTESHMRQNNSYAVAPFCDSSMGWRNHFLIETGAASTGSVGRIAGDERAGDEGFPARARDQDSGRSSAHDFGLLSGRAWSEVHGGGRHGSGGRYLLS